MNRAFIIFSSFVVYQCIAVGGAYVWANAGKLAAAAGTTATRQPSAEEIGVSMLVCAVLLVVLLMGFRLVRSEFVVRHNTSLQAADWGRTVTGFVCLAAGLSVLMTPFGLDDNGQLALFDSMKGSIWCLLLLTIVGPFVEELVFREGIVRSLVGRKVSPVKAVVLSAVLFGIVHGNWAQALPAVLLGFVFGLCYLRTGDLRLCFFLHVINNSLGVMLMFVPEIETCISAMTVVWQTGLGVMLLVAGGLMIRLVLQPVLNRDFSLENLGLD